MTIYAVYFNHGEILKAVGTKEECIKQLNWKTSSFNSNLCNFKHGRGNYHFVIWEE